MVLATSSTATNTTVASPQANGREINGVKAKPTITWEALPDDFVLPDDPVENIQQPILAAALTDALGANGRISPAMLMGSNFALVAFIDKQTVVKAPDWFYVPAVQPVPEDVIRRSYTPQSQGDPVAVVMEFLSASDCGELSIRNTPPYGKFYFYEQVLQVPTYVTYDPYAASIQVRYLNRGEDGKPGQYVLQPADESNRFWLPELQLSLGLWHGERLGKTTKWLRWWDKEGNLLLWSSEQAEVERQKAEVERQKAEVERQKAEVERQRADVLAAKLRELGIDPEAIE